MEALLRQLNELTEGCACGNPHTAVDMKVIVQSGALLQVKDYLMEQGYRSVCLTADQHTYEAAGRALHEHLTQAGIDVTLCMLKPNAQGDVLADASSSFQLLLGMNEDTDVILAVGSGTIHDIVRFVSGRVRRPFISIPTAASVDGFTSAGAPLIIEGVKKTIQTVAPIAIFADLDVLKSAPQELTAAGFADMLGKLTSLLDWQVSRDLGQEPFCQIAYQVTDQALHRCIEHVEAIASGTEEGITILMTSLIESGLSMLSLGHSRPASGGEHHVSHMWEMECIKHKRPHMLHGAQVGVAAVLLTDLYQRLARECTDQPALSVYNTLPDSRQLAEWLNQCGGPSTVKQLGIPAEWVQDTLRRAPDLRDRYTGLKYIRDHYPEWLHVM